MTKSFSIQRQLGTGMGLVSLALFLGYGCFGPPGTVACGQVTGFGPAMLESVEACPALTQRLGTPARFGFASTGCSNWEQGAEAGEGSAYGRLPVLGPNGAATLDYQLTKGGGLWHASVLIATFPDGSKVDVKACSASLEQQRGDAAVRHTLETMCERGAADSCESLARVLQARGDQAASRAALEKACALGLSRVCAKE